MIQDQTPLDAAHAQPRAVGEVRLSSKPHGMRSAIDGLRQAGSLKLLFPRTGEDALTAVLLNTAGGITGGDRFDARLIAGRDTALTVTTQAAERAYRAQPGQTGRVTNRLIVGERARLDWLPQETILFDGAALARRTEIDMAEDARFMGVESLIFGRAAMGERVEDLRLSDHVTLRKGGEIVLADRLRIVGAAGDHLSRVGGGRGSGAMASVIVAHPDAGARLEAARDLVGSAGGISQPCGNVLLARLLATDGFALRRVLIPLIACFRADPLPRPWMI